MITISLSEIVREAQKIQKKADKVAWLKKHDSKDLRTILYIMYNKNIKLNIPSSPPPYTPSTIDESHGMLYRETRKLVYFVVGGQGDGLKQNRREALFIQMLETVDKEDALLILDMIAQKPLKGLTHKTLTDAFGENFLPKD